MTSIARETLKQLANTVLDNNSGSHDLTLANGLAGQVLFLSMYANHSDLKNSEIDRTIELYRVLCAEIVSLRSTRVGLFDGLVGMLWAADRARRYLELQGNDFEIDVSDAVEFLDEYLELDIELEYDLVSGLVGIGIWALSLHDKTAAEKLLQKILKRLESSASKIENGITWATPSTRPFRIDSNEHNLEFNLGLAHGVPGVVGLLGRIANAGIGDSLAVDLLKGATNWLYGQANSRGSETVYGVSSNNKEGARLAWCYGDAGVLLALMHVDNTLVDPAIAKFRNTLIRASSSRRISSAIVVDSGICHGSAGLALTFDYIYRRTAMNCASEASRYWWEVLQSQKDQNSSAHFLHWDTEYNRFRPDYGLLVGCSGIGIAILTKLTSDWRWAEPFLISEHSLLASSRAA